MQGTDWKNVQSDKKGELAGYNIFSMTLDATLTPQATWRSLRLNNLSSTKSVAYSLICDISSCKSLRNVGENVVTRRLASKSRSADRRP